MGQPEDLTGAVLYLAGDGARFTTGAVLVIDGGQTLGGGIKVGVFPMAARLRARRRRGRNELRPYTLRSTIP